MPPAGTALEIMVIGGAEIYRAALPLASRLYLTRVHAQPEGDATFAIPPGGGWVQVSSAPLPRGPKDEFDCTLVVLERKTS
jgi:dihydrofolate reductase